MKKIGTIRVVHEPGDPPLKTDTDWARVEALTDEQIHTAALADPDAQPLPRDGRGLTKLVNVKKLREKLGMTQETFAELYRIPLGTLRDWEQRRKNPDAPARAYLQVIASNPETVAALLKASTPARSLWTTSLENSSR